MKPRRIFGFAGRPALLTSALILLVNPAFAGSTTPGTPDGSLPYLSTSTPQVSTPGAGTCAYQYNTAINDLNLAGLIDNGIGAAAAVTGAIAQGVLDEIQGGVDADLVAAFEIIGGALDEAGVAMLLDVPLVGTGDGASPGLVLAGLTFNADVGPAFGVKSAAEVVAGGVDTAALVTGLGSTVTGIGLQTDAYLLTKAASVLPFCDSEFTGTISADANINVKQGISVDNGAIWIGNPDGETYQEGISIGGGAYAGAGTGVLSTTDDGSAIAIGNGAHAGNGDPLVASGDLALGTGANATALHSTAIGENSSALANDATALGHGATADGTGATALGAGSAAHADGSIAIGNADVQLAATNGIAIGEDANAEAAGAVAMGFNADAVTADAVAIGTNAKADGSTAVGANSKAIGLDTAAFGKNAEATGTGDTAVGEFAIATGTDASAFGAHSLAAGVSVSALGTNAIAGGTGSTAIGDSAHAFNPADFLGGTNMTAVGQNAVVVADNSLAVGQNSRAMALNSTANGQNSQALALNTTASGQGSVASGTGASTYGQGSVASGTSSSAYGQGSVASGTNSSTFGQGSAASGTNSSAYGQGSTASGSNSTAYGQGTVASGEDSTAIGNGANASYSNSAAYGAGAVAVANNQQVFGTTSNRYTMPGLTSKDSTIRQVGPKSLVTSDANGNLAADRGLYEQIGQNRQGVAMAMALSNFWVPENKKAAIGINASTFDGTWAVGLNIGGEIYNNVYATGGVAYSESGMVSGRVGGVVSW